MVGMPPISDTSISIVNWVAFNGRGFGADSAADVSRCFDPGPERRRCTSSRGVEGPRGVKESRSRGVEEFGNLDLEKLESIHVPVI